MSKVEKKLFDYEELEDGFVINFGLFREPKVHQIKTRALAARWKLALNKLVNAADGERVKISSDLQPEASFAKVRKGKKYFATAWQGDNKLGDYKTGYEAVEAAIKCQLSLTQWNHAGTLVK